MPEDLDKAAFCGEPSYVWRAGQERRLQMIISAAGDRLNGLILENGCGVGQYVNHLSPVSGTVIGLEFDFERGNQAKSLSVQSENAHFVNSAGENLPFPKATFDLILSHEVIEHVQDDSLAVKEMVRVLRPGGRIVLFAPNRGYPFETHGIYLSGKYYFGNKPLINYLPKFLRDKLAPHVRVYTRSDIEQLFKGLEVKILERKVIFGAYDNIIARWPNFGRALRRTLHQLEKTPLKVFGLSHFWVVERI